VFPDGEVVEFSQRTRRMRDQANREWVVMHIGTHSAAVEPSATFAAAGQTAGLTPRTIEALQYVSRHEGGFDAINTWDRARFSWGFIQFAGGRGFPAVLSHFKATSPVLFRKLLGDYGVDILPVGNGRGQPVYVDPTSGGVLRGAPAEQAFGDNPLVVALFIRAGRVPEVKQRQVEAAIRDYAVPAMQDTFREIRVSEVLRSQQATAMLIDRKVHEGQITRLSAALEHASIIANRGDSAGWPAMEGVVLDLAVRDSDARTNIAELAEAAATELERAAEQGAAGGARREAALELLEKAIYEADYRMVVGYRRDGLRNGVAIALTSLAAGSPTRKPQQGRSAGRRPRYESLCPGCGSSTRFATGCAGSERRSCRGRRGRRWSIRRRVAPPPALPTLPF